ncbi:MAG: hypothetical protein IT368_03860, partial [Candidatus Hydrogenedentes bacterium]|nr:hypothetical protein [Candidatus Hydrogenedentota bacterium]
LLGISMGGLVAALLGEQYPDRFDGALCGCAPVGSFQDQINWFGDFRVVFDFFFPWLLPGSPTQIPRAVQDLCPLYYSFVIRPALADPLNAEKLRQFQAITQAPVDPANAEESWDRTLQILLWYNVFSTNDAAGKLGGQPYDNSARQYGGIPNAFWFNGLVRRYSADPPAAAAIAAAYETSGDTQIPMILLHTTLDPVVPYGQVAQYEEKAAAQGKAQLVTHIATAGYGHCLFGLPEVVTGLALAVKQAEGEQAGQHVVTTALEAGAWGAADREAFRDLAETWGFVVPNAPVPNTWLDWLIALLERLLQSLAG